MKIPLLTICLCITSFCLCFGENKEKTTQIHLEKGEKVWAGIINDGSLMPLKSGYRMDFYANNKYNQTQPLILTSSGQFVWSETPYEFIVGENEITVNSSFGEVITGKHGTNLKEVQQFTSQKFFPASGLLPDTLLISSPQYNTWIELNYNQNQAAILSYAKAIIDNGFPPGVIMIDDSWQEDYGVWSFHPGRFSNPKEMIRELHAMGFKVMLWICPFVSADQARLYTKLKDDQAFLLEEGNKEPAMIRWWDGVSALLDFSNPKAVTWFNNQLDYLVKDYGIDGFKFDAGDMEYYPANTSSMGNFTPNQHCERYAQFGLRFPLNEYRACWKMGGKPLVQRLADKSHKWEDLQLLIPNMIVEGLMGYPFSCPDMIGGGGLSVFFTERGLLNQDLVVRSAQCHALMPMMQFSVAPWRVLDKEHLEAVQKAVAVREKFKSLILKLAHKSAISGEPILKSLEYVFPGQGFENITDQFMLGDNLLVAPMLLSGQKGRNIMLPKGRWKADDGQIFTGGKEVFLETPINRLPYFERIN